MSKGNRNEEPSSGIIASIALLTVFVLGTTLIWALSEQGPKQVANTYEASKYHVSAQNRVEATCGGLEGAALAECSIQIEQSERENHQTQKDIRAQRYMAIWAFLMAFGAIGTLGVTAVGLAWIKATLDETRRAVKSADDAVAVTREIGQAQVRAYLSAQESDFSTMPHFFRCKVGVFNSGQSPAREISLKAYIWANSLDGVIRLSEKGGGEAQAPKTKTKVFEFVSVDIPAGKSANISLDFFDTDYEAFYRAVSESRLSPIEIRCRLTWTDVFNDQQFIFFNLVGFKDKEDKEKPDEPYTRQGPLRVSNQWETPVDGFEAFSE